MSSIEPNLFDTEIHSPTSYLKPQNLAVCADVVGCVESYVKRPKLWFVGGGCIDGYQYLSLDLGKEPEWSSIISTTGVVRAATVDSERNIVAWCTTSPPRDCCEPVTFSYGALIASYGLRSNERYCYPSSVCRIGETFYLSEKIFYIYSPRIDPWRKLSESPVVGGGHADVVAMDSTFVAFGNDTLTGMGPVSKIARYDPPSDRWCRIADYSMELYGIRGWFLDGTIIASGGRRPPSGTASLTMGYDPREDRWRWLGSMNYSRSAHRMLQYSDHTIIAMGGNMARTGLVGGRCVTVCESYDTRADRWSLEERWEIPEFDVTAAGMLV